jgi:spore maturation protein CgeB
MSVRHYLSVVGEGYTHHEGILKVLIINTDYSEFLSWLYRQHPGLEGRTYDEQLRIRYATVFGVADFYSKNLRELGHDATDVYANNTLMQHMWAKAQGVEIGRSGGEGAWRWILRNTHSIAAQTPLRLIKPLVRPLIKRVERSADEMSSILAAQIAQYKPDVILNQAMDGIENRFLKVVKPLVRLIVGQHAATPLPDDEDYSCYDLIISSFPPTIEWFRKKGIGAVMNRLGFEPSILTIPARDAQKHPVTFVGSISAVHSSRIAWLQKVCARVPELRIWGPGFDQLPPSSPLRRCHMGVVWGREMYEILRNSRITLNHHGDIAPYANNCRLFEATGMGAMLVTDSKVNLQDLFEPGKEVATYRSPEECAEVIRYYLDHEEAREAIARAGQVRTLQDHTYRHRMREFVEIVQERLAA